MSESYKVYASQEYVDSKVADVSSLPSGSSPNQYLVTDGDGNAKWEDKLAWSDKEVVLEEQTIHLNRDAYTVTEVGDIVVGESYVVGYQGKQYNCVARTISMEGLAVPVLGNSWVLDDENEVDSGEPFVYLEFPKEVASQLGFSAYFMPSGSERGEYPDSIVAYIHKETIHKLSGKYVEGMGWSDFEVLVPKTEFKYPYADEYFGDNIPLVIGSEYKVVFDDVTYMVTCFESDGCPTIGAPYDGIEDFDYSSYPFTVYNDDEGAIWVSCKTDGDHTIEGCTETIHPIDKKYLPRQDWYYYSTPDCVLYKDVNLTDAVTIADMEDVLSCGKFREVYDGEVGGDIRFAGGAFFNPGKTKGFKVSSVSAHSDGTVNVLELKSSDYKAAGPM